MKKLAELDLIRCGGNAIAEPDCVESAGAPQRQNPHRQGQLAIRLFLGRKLQSTIVGGGELVAVVDGEQTLIRKRSFNGVLIHRV